MNLSELFQLIRRPHLCVVGDLMLDRYIWGEAGRMSPESPVPIVRVERDENRLGGAAGVARLAAALDATVTLSGIVGTDREADDVFALLNEARVTSTLVQKVHDRPTTLKTRIVGMAAGKHPHQMLRFDRERSSTIPTSLSRSLAEGILNGDDRFDALIISDYDKGTCTEQLIERLISWSKQSGVPTIVDPARGVDYRRYRGASLLKPNRTALELAAGVKIGSVEDAFQAAKTAIELFEVAALLVTLDKDGMVFVERGKDPELLPADRRNVYDITGAGDMVSAALGVCLGGGISLPDASRIANSAAGLQVDRFGVTPISRTELVAELGRRATRRSASTALTELDGFVRDCRTSGKRVVFTNGCFDLLHIGHIRYLEEAATLGDVLIVAVNDDATVTRLKGASRPIVPAEQRAAHVAALACVDRVVLMTDMTPCNLIERLRPDVLVKGGSTDEILGRDIVEGYGGVVVRGLLVPEISTTAVVEKIQRLHSTR